MNRLVLAKHCTDRDSSSRVDSRTVVDGREWWLLALSLSVIVLLTGAIVSLTLPGHLWGQDDIYWSNLREWVRGLAALVLLFNVYTVYQHLQVRSLRRALYKQARIFELISENAADMIAVVDAEGNRLYNSPAYQKVLGYSADDLKNTSTTEQIHPEDRERVVAAAEKARHTGRGERLEYRMMHKDGSWRVLESTASVIRNERGKPQELVIVNRDITDRKRVEEMLAHNILHDRLTALPNRALFVDRLRQALVRARRHADYEFAVLFLDIDEFRRVNESLGHAVGDQLLLEVGKRLVHCFRESDTVSRTAEAQGATSDVLARLGGDEFTVLLEDVSKPSDAIRVAQRIQAKLGAPFEALGQEIVLGASVGIVMSSTTYPGPDEILRDAELALYRAKTSGKAQAVVFDPAMHSAALNRLQLERDLRRALELKELRVHYQPIVSLSSGKIVGFEALSRWQRSDRLVMPAEFIPVADETGLIVNINRELLLDACQQLRTWQTQSDRDTTLSISVNVAPRQFAGPGLVDDVRDILLQTGIQPDCLQLEIMETIAMQDAERAERVLCDLKALGVRLGIDDFGVGYSSLSRLRRFPVDTLKIDRVFVSAMEENRENREIVRAIITLAQTLGLKVVAEGTETQPQIEQLRALGCDMAQGYFFSRPCDVTTASKLLNCEPSPSFS
jgi:diguanylate cyclase (GGDEF)-like protein/PAS domain S-box-containing protein